MCTWQQWVLLWLCASNLRAWKQNTKYSTIIPRISADELARNICKVYKKCPILPAFGGICIHWNENLVYSSIRGCVTPIVAANAPLFKTWNRIYCSAALFSKEQWWCQSGRQSEEPWDEEEEMEAGKVAGTWSYDELVSWMTPTTTLIFFQFSVHL